MKKYALRAFTLTELMVVLVIIGILVLLALPSLQGLFGQAYEVEAKTNLKHIYNLQKMEYQRNFTYTSDLKQIEFEIPKLKSQGGNAVYAYSVSSSSKTSFIVRATAVEDFDGDGNYNVWEIDSDNNLREITPD